MMERKKRDQTRAPEKISSGKRQIWGHPRRDTHDVGEPVWGEDLLESEKEKKQREG